MIWSKAMKYPVLIMGIIMFTLFISNGRTQNWWQKAKRRFIPSTCDSLLTRLNPKVPKSWKMSCPTIDLLILEYEHKKKSPIDEMRVEMYKKTANIIVQFSKMANPETLEDLQAFRLIIKTSRLEILSQTDGEAMIAFRKLEGKQKIAEHLKLTVKVKETIK